MIKGYNFWKASPQQNLGGQKTSKIFVDFLTAFEYDRKYETDRHNENRKSTRITTAPPTFGEKKFGEICSTNKKVI